jgi:hypothetical protein
MDNEGEGLLAAWIMRVYNPREMPGTESARTVE